jgi:hypothetical protein
MNIKNIIADLNHQRKIGKYEVAPRTCGAKEK